MIVVLVLLMQLDAKFRKAEESLLKAGTYLYLYQCTVMYDDKLVMS